MVNNFYDECIEIGIIPSIVIEPIAYGVAHNKNCYICGDKIKIPYLFYRLIGSRTNHRDNPNDNFHIRTCSKNCFRLSVIYITAQSSNPEYLPSYQFTSKGITSEGKNRYSKYDIL